MRPRRRARRGTGHDFYGLRRRLCRYALHPYERETAPLAEACRDVRTGDVVISIGPEGGYAEKEVAYAEQHFAWCRTVSLGPRILRAETASLAALSIIMYERGFK